MAKVKQAEIPKLRLPLLKAPDGNIPERQSTAMYRLRHYFIAGRCTKCGCVAAEHAEAA